MNRDWSLTSLGKVIKYRKEFIAIDDTQKYKRCRVQCHAKGVVVRDIVQGSEIKTKKQQPCRTGEFLIAEIDAKMGGFGIVPESLDGAIVSSHYFLFEINEQLLDRSFFNFFIRTPFFCEQVAAQGSTNYAAIRPQEVLTYQIPLPPLDQQRRIVARIEELAAKVEEARGLRRQSVEYGLPSLRNGIFRKAFQGKFLDYSTNEFPKDELSSIGKWVRLGDICSLITDGTHQTPTYTEKGMMFLSAQNIKPYRFMPKNHKYVSYEDYLAYTARNKVQKGDILITRVGAGIGEVAMVDQDIDFAIYVSLGHIRAIQDFVYTPYLVHWLNSPAGVAQSREKILGKGHSQGNLNLNLIRQFLVPLPPLPEQHRIAVYLDNLQAKVDALKRLQAETAAELDALLPSILDKAFKGEL
jgi:type I restriction enzyme S subunit